jgi:hypothetical protein
MSCMGLQANKDEIRVVDGIYYGITEYVEE